MSGLMSEQRLDELLARLGEAEASGQTGDKGNGAELPPELGQSISGALGRRGRLRRKSMLRSLKSTLLIIFVGLLTVAGLTLWPRGNGWAVTDGWIVEYEIEVPAYYGFDFVASGVQGVESPQSQLEQLVRDWSAEHANAAPAEGVGLAELNVHQPMPQTNGKDPGLFNFFVHRAPVTLTFRSDDEELLDELLALLRSPGEGLPGLQGEVKKYSKTWYVREKYPQIYEERTLTVDGRELHFPRDFPGNIEDSMLAGMLPDPQATKDRSSMLYYNLLTDAERELTGAGLLTRLEVKDGQLSVTTIEEDTRYRELRLPADLRLGIQMGGGYNADGTPQPPDSNEFYLDALYQFLRERSANHQEDYETVQVWGLEYLLFPRERFEPGQPAQSYRVTEADRSHALALAARYSEAFSAAFPGYAELRLEDGNRAVSAGAGGQLESARLGMPITEQPHYSFTVILRGPEALEAEKIKAVLDQVDPGATSFSWRLRDDTMRRSGH